MASKVVFTILLLVVGFLSIMPLPVAADYGMKRGYTAMSMTIAMTLHTLVPDITTPITIFFPRDDAFSTQPPLSLLRYHVIPTNLDSHDILQSSVLPFETTFDTLLPGHSLVLTTLPGGGPASINGVKITEWNIYNDGRVTIHGVEDFFDPAFETAVHEVDQDFFDPANPDGEATDNDGDTKTITDSDAEFDILSWVKDHVVEMLLGFSFCFFYFQ